MEQKTLLKASLKRHKGSLAGIFLLIFLVSLSLATVLSVWNNSSRYVRGEMERLGFGGITAWVSGIPDAGPLSQEISSLDDVEQVGVQSLIFSNYRIGGQESDSEGQLITYDPQEYPYKIFADDLSGYQEGAAEIAPGEAYVSPSLRSMFGVQVGDEISFPIARTGVEKSLVVKGYFEDPFMGSSMIGMKGFLICAQDHDEIAQRIAEAGIDFLARPGYMLHVFQRAGSAAGAAELNSRLNRETSLPAYAEFVHTQSAISGFMLTLQNILTGLLLAFVAILTAVSMVVLGHSIGSAIEQDTVNMGILKTVGFTSGRLRAVQLLQYLSAILPGMTLGAGAAVWTAGLVCRMTVTTTGLLVPSTLSAGLCVLSLAAILLLLLAFIWLKTGRIGSITPIRAIRGSAEKSLPKAGRSPIRQRGLGFWMALRQLLTGKKRYLSICIVAALLVFFASLAGRMDSWLGPHGEGMMDSFNPADLHIAAQPVGDVSTGDVEQTIAKITGITDRYMLAMPGVSVNGVDYTANVITDPERFHLLEGRACTSPNEIVLTEIVAADLKVGVGGTVTAAAGLGSREYVVSGIYQCANDLGANIGMSREGYGLIGQEAPAMWCVHYFLEDPSQQPAVMQALADRFGGDVYVHENSWPGLSGILSAMQLLMLLLYGVSAAVVLVVTLLAAGRLLTMEQGDLGIYKALGFSANRLRLSFALRFGVAALFGSVIGICLSAAVTDPLVSSLMRAFGISGFSSQPGIGNTLLPAAAVIILFLFFAYLAAGKLKKGTLINLISD